jgi:hypothetical protein
MAGKGCEQGLVVCRGSAEDDSHGGVHLLMRYKVQRHYHPPRSQLPADIAAGDCICCCGALPCHAGQVAAAAQVAQWLGADWQDVVPVVNATSAVNTVVNSLQLGPGDLLLMNNATYPAVSVSRLLLLHACCTSSPREDLQGCFLVPAEGCVLVGCCGVFHVCRCVPLCRILSSPYPLTLCATVVQLFLYASCVPIHTVCTRTCVRACFCAGLLQVKSTLAAAAQRSGAQLLELVGDARGWTVSSGTRIGRRGKGREQSERTHTVQESKAAATEGARVMG